MAGRWLIRFEPSTGCLSDVFDRESQLPLCPANGRMNWGMLRYEHRGRQDYQHFLNAYMGAPPRPWWAEEDFKKWGLDLETRETATLRCGSAVVERGATATSVRNRLQCMGESRLKDGCPVDPWLLWTFSHETARIDLTIGWPRKPATGFPEALWLGFRMPGMRGNVVKIHYWSATISSSAAAALRSGLSAVRSGSFSRRASSR
ncbi:MAG: DUF5054 domain-containing protein [Oceanipulchritudo sp.]